MLTPASLPSNTICPRLEALFKVERARAVTNSAPLPALHLQLSTPSIPFTSRFKKNICSRVLVAVSLDLGFHHLFFALSQASFNSHHTSETVLTAKEIDTIFVTCVSKEAVTMNDLKKKDPERADSASDSTPVVKHRHHLNLKKAVMWAILLAFGVGAVFGLGVLASVCERSLHSNHGLAVLESPEVHKDPKLDTRGDRHADEEYPPSIMPPVPRLAEDAPMLMASPTPTPSDDEGLMIPISTQTELSTIYSLSKLPKTTEYPVTVEASTSIAEDTSCIVSVVTTETKIAVVTVTVIPTTSDHWSGYVTITGDASTVTAVNTETSYTSGLPDATVSGNPSTITDVQTMLSVTSGLPDATVSGNPSTITDVQTQLSVTSAPPDATVSGNPSTVTNLDATYSLTSTSTARYNTKLTIVISDLWQTTSSAHSTVTTVVTRATTATTTDAAEVSYASNVDGATASSDRHETISSTASITATVFLSEPPYPSNGTAYSHPYGTLSSVVAPTTPVVVSGANDRVGPCGTGFYHVYAMVLVAVIMSLY
ncbi:unnamed protein product [Clonostachys rosea f. rosea IK726]|uniref:Uncharacterized protein n=1 Tax=Clonostachys rosea f. rosea IK726 TaxID=1349383 RepID=A0ACA9TA68_BIOOC|nr:unnamed protein product [Clonostachys rosea f. rosea IK726]